MSDDSTGHHYERGSLIGCLEAALTEAGLTEQPLRPDALAALDQFHSRGLAATKELAQALHLDGTTRVLDIGAGLGGPSRYLAATYGCTVQGIDLSVSFVEAATFLAQRTGLADRVSYQCANALSLPFDDATFDVAWTQHVAMNIANREQLYSEAFRVLRPGGRFAIFDVITASDAPPQYPVPWAATPETSFLVTAERMRELLLEQGFRIASWTDTTAEGVAWFAARREKEQQQPSVPPLGLHIVMGPGFRDMSANLARNLREGKLALLQAIVEKP